MTTSVDLKWAKRNPNKPSLPLKWTFPSQIDKNTFISLERDIRHFYGISVPLYVVTIESNGRPTTKPFYSIQSFGSDIILTKRPYVCPKGLLSFFKYQYSCGAPVKVGQCVYVHGDTSAIYKIVKGKGGNVQNPLVKVKSLSLPSHTIKVAVSELKLL